VPAWARVFLEQFDIVRFCQRIRRSETGDSGTDYRYSHNQPSFTCEYWFGMTLTTPEPLLLPPDPDDEPEVAEVGTVRPHTSRVSQVVTVIAILVPLLGVAMAMGLLWNIAFHWSDVAIMLGMYVVCAFGTTIGFHRYFTHKGFDAHPSVKATLAILGCMTMQGPITQWVTDHRKHHAFSDKEGDPHSPHVGHGDGIWGVIRGFIHAHVGWMFTNMGMEQGMLYGRDLYDDTMIRWIDRLYLVWVGLTLGIPFLIGYAIGGVDRGVEAMVWGGLVRIFLYQHATFSVNSICHMWGASDYRSRDESRNNRLVAYLVFGEGWHNNHHAFPASARHGLHRGQIDMSWMVIRGLEKLGLVSNVRVPDAAQLERRRVIKPS
jgi:stearoyl-CoA desaturase (delta-9 desaturase)